VNAVSPGCYSSVASMRDRFIGLVMTGVAMHVPSYKSDGSDYPMRITKLFRKKVCCWRLYRRFSTDATHHLLHDSASNVVRTGRSVNGNRPKLTPCRSETPLPIKTKLNTIHNVRGNSSKAETHHQPIKGAPPTKAQHISILLVFFYFILFVSCHRAQQKRLGRF
jgi:hypothetical protein